MWTPRRRWQRAPRAAASIRSAPRGRWTATLTIEGLDGEAGALSFSVEDFAPQRLAVDTAGNEKVPVRAGETRNVGVTARFLYGAIGAGLQTQGEARLAADPNPFPAFKDYRWGDEKDGFQEKFLELGSSVTDGNGVAILAVNAAEAGETAVPLKATVTASVFEPGGRPVRESLFLKVRTRPLYYGVKIDEAEGGGSNPAVGIDVIAVDAAGNRIAAPGTTPTSGTVVASAQASTQPAAASAPAESTLEWKSRP